MHDINFIRQNPELFDKEMQKRGVNNLSAKILTIDKEHKKQLTELQILQNKRNSLAQEFAIFKKNGKDTAELNLQSNQIKEEIALLETSSKNLSKELNNYLISLPNIANEDVVFGKSEKDNIEILKWGNIKSFDFTPIAHYDIGEKLAQMDFARAAKVSGSRFVILQNDLAKLERAIANFMLDVHTKEFGYIETYCPLLVNENSMFGTGQLPKFKDEQFQTTDGYWLIPTAETPLSNMFKDEILSHKDLPIRLTSYTQCFRAEAGAAGKDTRGMIRNHQFSKVELVSIVKQEDSAKEHERMTSAAQAILQYLELPYRKMLLCSQDMGFCAQKTYDLEVWLASINGYREISSCSMCGDFQARRMNTKYKNTEGKNIFVHTLNGSGLAVGRTLVAILENYQNKDGSVTVPEVLQSYMKKDKIEKA